MQRHSRRLWLATLAYVLAELLVAGIIIEATKLL